MTNNDNDNNALLLANEIEPNDKGPKLLPYLFEKELIDKQNKHIHLHLLYDDFRATKKMYAPIEGKFYSQYEQLETAHVAKHLILMQKRREPFSVLPHCRSQMYGWLPIVEDNNRSVVLDVRQINFICAPKQRCDMTTYGERLYSERHTERQPFNGLRFYV